MCDMLTRSTIQEVVNMKSQANEMFTAFDVSLKVQEVLKNRKAFDHSQHRHRDLKNDVHDICQNSMVVTNYNRVLRDVGAPTPAWVYYPNGSDPANYVPRVRNDAPSAAVVALTPVGTFSSIQIPAISTVPAGTPVLVSTNDDDCQNRAPDTRGTLTVPATLLRKAGFSPTDEVVAVSHNWTSQKCVVLRKYNGTLPDGASLYTVDKANNVRITKYCLDQAGLNSPTFDFEIDNNTLVILEH